MKNARTRVTVEMPKHAADKLMVGFKNKDPEVMALFKEFGVVNVVSHQDRVDLSSDRVIAIQDALKASGCPEESLEEATLECLAAQDRIGTEERSAGIIT